MREMAAHACLTRPAVLARRSRGWFRFVAMRRLRRLSLNETTGPARIETKKDMADSERDLKKEFLLDHRGMITGRNIEEGGSRIIELFQYPGT